MSRKTDTFNNEPPMVQVVPRLVHAKRPFPPPRNGTTYVVLIAGGNGDMYRDLSKRLEACYPISHTYHLERPKDFSRGIPIDVDLVMVLVNHVGHSKSEQVVALAKDRGIPILFSLNKWAEASTRLDAYGLPRRIEVYHRPPEQPKVELVDGQSASPLSVPETPPPAEVVAKAEEDLREAEELKRLEEEIRAIEEKEAAEKAAQEAEQARKAAEAVAQDEALAAIEDSLAQEAANQPEPLPEQPSPMPSPLEALRTSEPEQSVEVLVRMLAKAMRRENVKEVSLKRTKAGKVVVTIVDAEG